MRGFLESALVLANIICIANSKQAGKDLPKIEIISQWIPPDCIRKVQLGDAVRYHYYGMLTDGTYFDSSYERGRSYNTQVGVGWLIRGMDDALIGMCINEHRVVAIPPDLAYGDEGTGDVIPGGATILFNFVLLDISNEKDTIQILVPSLTPKCEINVIKITTTRTPPDCKRTLVSSDYIRYHYNGTLMNGEKFYSSYDDEQTYDTYVGNGWLIRGMEEGLLGSCMGEMRTIIIPPHLGYGSKGDDKKIPPEATLRFDVEIIDFHNPNDTAEIEVLSTKYGKDKNGKDLCPRRIEDTDYVRYHYNVSLVDGKVFDSSYSRNHTYDTYIGFKKIIPGMEKGLLGMCVGEKRKITIPPHLAYGEAGVENKIPGSAVLVFDVFLVDVHNPKDDVKMDVLTPPPKDCQRKAAQDDFLTYDYDLELMDGTKLDSSKDKPGPWATYMGRGSTVAGLERALEGMCVGEVKKATIPPHLGFGEPGTDTIPGSAVLVYTLNLHKIEDSLPEGFVFMWKKSSTPDNLFSLIDIDEDKKLTLDEFLSYILKEVDSGVAKILPGAKREDVVEELFKKQDADKDGFLSQKELKIPLPKVDSLGEKVDDEL